MAGGIFFSPQASRSAELGYLITREAYLPLSNCTFAQPIEGWGLGRVSPPSFVMVEECFIVDQDAKDTLADP